MPKRMAEVERMASLPDVDVLADRVAIESAEGECCESCVHATSSQRVDIACATCTYLSDWQSCSVWLKVKQRFIESL